ncbi:MAG: ZIP family metal transporter [Firmicutes bacterium]|nr:ZIP family metal transporter [Bacillota bacterium]
MLNVLLMAFVAGMLSSILGGVIVLFIKKPSKKLIGLAFAFAAAVLTTLVLVDFVPHAIGRGHYHSFDADGNLYPEPVWYQHGGAGIWFTLLGLAIGGGLAFALSFFDKHGHEHVHGITPHSEDCSHEISKSERRKMFAIAFTVAFAIILHDIPKGLAIGASGSIVAAIVIGLSCVPEGMSIAIPMKAGGSKWWKILAVCSIAGFATVLGALLGYAVGGINTFVAGMAYAIAAGCLLGVVFTEMLPMAYKYSNRSKWMIVVIMTGTLMVIALNYFFHDLMH